MLSQINLLSAGRGGGRAGGGGFQGEEESWALSKEGGGCKGLQPPIASPAPHPLSQSPAVLWGLLGVPWRPQAFGLMSEHRRELLLTQAAGVEGPGLVPEV